MVSDQNQNSCFSHTLVHHSQFQSNLILSNNPWTGHHLVHLFTGPANMSRLSLSLPYKLKMSNIFLSQAYKGVTNWMTAFIDYTSNMLAEKNTLLISFSINIFLCEDMSHELSKLIFSMFWLGCKPIEKGSTNLWLLLFKSAMKHVWIRLLFYLK